MTSSPTAARRGLLTLGIALATMLPLAACGDDTPAATTTSSSSTSSTTTTVAPTPGEQVTAAIEAVGGRYTYTRIHSRDDAELFRIDGEVSDEVEVALISSAATRSAFVSARDGYWTQFPGEEWVERGDGSGYQDVLAPFASPLSAEIVESDGDDVVVDAVYETGALSFGATGETTVRITIEAGVVTRLEFGLAADDGIVNDVVITVEPTESLEPFDTPPTGIVAALAPLPLTPFEATDPLVGTYVRRPATNGYHVGGIVALGDGTYQWTNQAPVVWALVWDEATSNLLTTDDNPYAGASGAAAFTIDDYDPAGIDGFWFLGEFYERVSPIPFGALNEYDLAGAYHRLPVENPFHTGRLSIAIEPTSGELPDEGGMMWTADDGTTWILTWDPIIGALVPVDPVNLSLPISIGLRDNGFVAVRGFDHFTDSFTKMG